MNTIYILVAIWAMSAEQIQTQYIDKYATSTACERAAAANSDDREKIDGAPMKKYDCISYKR